MANPQLNDGYTSIANELLEQFMRLPLNGTQWRIIWTVLRYTYGFHKKSHELSVGFFEKSTSCQRKQIQRELNRLIEMKVLTVEGEASFSSSRRISLNKNYDEYELDTRELIRTHTPYQALDQGANQTPTRDLIRPPIKKTLNIKDISAHFDDFYLQYPNAKERQRTMKNWQTALKTCKEEELILAAQNYASEVKGRDKVFIKTSANFLGREKIYLDYIRGPEQKPKLSRDDFTIERKPV